jgi:hypothetical protein
MRFPWTSHYRGKHDVQGETGGQTRWATDRSTRRTIGDPSRRATGAQTRRTLTVWRTAALLVTAAAIVALLGAEPLHRSADLMQPSVFRTAALAVTGAMARASEVLHTDWPWQQVAVGGEAAAVDGLGEQTTTTASVISTLPPTTARPVTTVPGATTTSSTTTTEPPTTTTTLPLFTEDKPLRVLVVGDSLMNPIGFALMRQTNTYPALQVKSITKVSSGLVRPDFYNWPEVIAEAVAEYHPHVTVMLFGGNEKQVMRYQGQSLVAFSDEWNAEYARRVEQAIEISTRAGASVIWIGMPVMRSSKFSETARTLNAFYENACAEEPAATYIDGYSLFSDSDGAYSAYLKDSAGNNQLMREGDGIHLSNKGGDRVAEEIMKVLLAKYRLE